MNASAPVAAERLSGTRFRQVAGCFTTGVTVLTTGHDDDLRGTTVNSFVTVSIDPVLLVLVSLATDGQAAAAATGGFVVNVLAEDQAETARCFARSDRPAGKEAFAALRWRAATHTGAPILLDGVAYFDCAVTETVPAGDHTLFLAEVQDFDSLSPRGPLIFLHGRLSGV